MWPFQSFWFGDTLSPYERLCLRSFVDHGHTFHLYTFASDLAVPAGVRLLDAAELISPTEYFTYQSGPGIGSHAAFSNLFRYKLLAERGGWWVDTDVICLTDQIPSCDRFFALESPDKVNGAVLFFKPGDSIVLESLTEASRIRDQARWGEIGPRLLTNVINQADRLREAKPPETCYPVHYTSALALLDPSKSVDLLSVIERSTFLHLWNEIFRRSNVRKSALPPAGSLLRHFADKHPVEGWSGEYTFEILSDQFILQQQLREARKEITHHSKHISKLERGAAGSKNANYRNTSILAKYRQFWKRFRLLASN